MFSFLLAIIRAIILKLATTGVFNFMMPTLLKLDKWCEDKLGIDNIFNFIEESLKEYKI